MKKYAIGVDVGGTSVKMGLFTLEGNIQKKWEVRTRKENGGEFILSDIAASIRKELGEENIDLEEVSGVGIGVPGPVNEEGFVEVCVNLGWKKMWPANVLSPMLGGIPVKIGNDANVAALGEQWLGSGRGAESLVMLTLGTGVGGGIILNGRMIAGRRGLGGELGHMTVNPDETRTCNCGNRGCLEQYGSATGVTTIAAKLLEEHDEPSSLRGHRNSAKEVFDAAKAGDALAIQAAETLGNYLGLAMANMSLAVDPDMFVIGGGVSKAGEYLREIIERHYHEHMHLSEKYAEVTLATLGNDAGICGAARLVL